MEVVNVKREKCTHYIGRGRAPSGIVAFLGNPHRIGDPHPETGKPMTRAEVIERFEITARNSPSIMRKIGALPESAIIGCWCRPEACHGDSIVKLWNELRAMQGQE